MQLAFLINKHLTMPYADIAKGLAAQGHVVFWLSPSRRWARWLVDRGEQADRVLTLPDLAGLWKVMPIATARRALEPLELAAGLTIANVILMDRVLRRVSDAAAYGFLAVAAAAIRRFLLEHEIGVCFGEATWAWEILTWMVCRSLERPCLAFTTIRIPSDRFAFFDSATHQVIEHRAPEPPDRRWAAGFLESYRARPSSPIYARGQPTALQFRRHWLEELRLALTRPAINQHDFTIWPMRHRMIHRLRLAANAAALRLAPPFARSADRPSDQRFVLFCLHHQPEASIDVVAALHSNQAHAVERLARVLPASHELWVKEHANGLGDRSRGWLCRLARLPGVRLIDPGESSLALLRRADLVVTPAGTVAYEAALLGVPAATLGTLYFSPLMAARGDPISWPLAQILARPVKDRASPASDERVVAFLAWLHAQSFPGFPDRLAGAAMAGRPDEANLAAVLAGFEPILAWVARRAALPALVPS
jgi:hypothetical protein